MDKPYAGVLCRLCGPVDLTRAQYDEQMEKPNALWFCPRCMNFAVFDEARFEALNPEID